MPFVTAGESISFPNGDELTQLFRLTEESRNFLQDLANEMNDWNNLNFMVLGDVEQKIFTFHTRCPSPTDITQQVLVGGFLQSKGWLIISAFNPTHTVLPQTALRTKVVLKAI